MNNFFLTGVTEPSLNILLARLLERRELQALGEATIHKKTKGPAKKPDVLITLNGIKIIIEGKFASPNVAANLEKQCLSRIEEGLCEICIGLQYPEIHFKTLSPTQKEVENHLLRATFKAFTAFISAPEIKRVYWQEVDINQLASLVRSSYTSVVTEDMVGQAVQSFANALQEAAGHLTASVSTNTLALKMAAIMEIPLTHHVAELED